MDPHETKIYYALLTGLTVLLGLVVFFIITILRYHRKTTATRRDRIKEDVNSVEKERERVAIDLHDDLGASLSAIKLHLHRLYQPGDENYKEVQNIGLQVDELMDRMRVIAHELMPRELTRRGLGKALQLLVDRISDSSGLPIKYSCTVDHFDRNHSVHLYRIAQEILNNVVKHSGATSVSFSVCRREGKIRLEISDNGIGFNAKAVMRQSRGSGLRNISERVELMKGLVYLTSGLKKGVTYEIEIPEI